MGIDWGRGYQALWRMASVDPRTWSDGATVGRVTSVDVARDVTGDAPLVETATVHVDLADGEDFAPGWYRVEMVAVQDGAAELAEVFTGLFEESTAEELSGGYRDAELAGRSVLQPVADLGLLAGSYTYRGEDGAGTVGDELRAATPAPVEVDGSFPVGTTVVHDVGATRLEACWAVLRGDGWGMRVSGDGSVTVRRDPVEPSAAFGGSDAMLVDGGASRDRDLSEVPNRYYAIDQDSGQMAVATNEDAASEVSYQARGRWVDEVDDSPKPRDGETLDAYAARRLSEESTVETEVEYKRKYRPGIEAGDLVSTPWGTGTVAGQSYDCDNGIEVTETLRVKEALWDGE